jgi:hypothetical protein
MQVKYLNWNYYLFLIIHIFSGKRALPVFPYTTILRPHSIITWEMLPSETLDWGEKRYSQQCHFSRSNQWLTLFIRRITIPRTPHRCRCYNEYSWWVLITHRSIGQTIVTTLIWHKDWIRIFIFLENKGVCDSLKNDKNHDLSLLSFSTY